MRNKLLSGCIGLLFCGAVASASLPDGYWSLDRSQPILDTTLRVTLDPDLSHLSAAEFQALEELLAAGRIMHRLYENQKHAEAGASLAALEKLHRDTGESAATRNLLELFYLSKGPIATDLDNARVPIVPVGPEHPGKNVYPPGLTRAEIDAYLARHPEKTARIKDERTVVRRATAENLAADMARLDANPAIATLRPGLRDRLAAEPEDANGFYAVPYALAYAEDLARVRHHLLAAADLVRRESRDFAAYLENRSRDLLSGDYESGDAAWVRGEFANLNIQIGSYETYDDALLGVKAFFSASILTRDADKSAALADAMAGLQAIEDSLPYENHETVRRRIPVGIYRVIADFGQARGANTATILPNDPDHARKYGRTILIRHNILANPALFANIKKRFDAVVDPRFRDHLRADGTFNRTLWHEVGHYLGPAVTADGRGLNATLADIADLFEELKSDLVSLFAAPALRTAGYYDDAAMRAQYADGIRRTLQTVQPRPEQPYQNMQLMQFNYYMERGLLALDEQSGQLVINYTAYHEVVSQMLADVLQIQYSGDSELAREFVSRWNYWDAMLHGVLAAEIRASGSFRRTLVRYHALQ